MVEKSEDNQESKLKDILEWEPKRGKWMYLGSLKQERCMHGISVIKFKDYDNYCQPNLV